MNSFIGILAKLLIWQPQLHTKFWNSYLKVNYRTILFLFSVTFKLEHTII